MVYESQRSGGCIASPGNTNPGCHFPVLLATHLDSGKEAYGMALTKYQIEVIRLLAESRKKAGIRYIAGGVALNQVLNAPRVSQDIDVFRDTEEALWKTWISDRGLLERMFISSSNFNRVPIPLWPFE
jgi:hypothetical protein